MSGKLRWLSDHIAANAGDTPMVANGVLYIGSGSIESAHVGSVFALDASTGRTLWISPATDDAISTAPTVANGRVYVATGNRNGKLYAFHLR